MRKRNVCAIFCLLLTSFVFHKGLAQNVFKTTSPSVIGYLEYLPQDYKNNSDKYPVMIFLHGIGERGPNTTDVTTLSQSISNVAKLGPPLYVKNGTQFPFILISPQLKNNNGTWPSAYVMEVINHVKTYLRIDEKRIYLTGLSLGGGGAWVAAQDYPELFAAIAPVCGGYNSPSKACGLASENLPVWAFHGDADTVVPMSKSINMVNAINACTPKPTPLAKITIYPGVTHNAWSKAYKTDNTVHTPNLYQWITSFTNVTNKGNKIPAAHAGTDKSISTSTVILKGTASDPDGSIATYAWTQMSGPNVSTLINNLTNTLTVTNLIPGSYIFRLTAKDNSGNTDSDYVGITVAVSNALPTVNAGADKTLSLPANTVSLSGSATDSDGTIKTLAWIKVTGPSASLGGTSTANLSVTNMVAGTYTFRLTATDDKGAAKADNVSVIVKTATTANKPPVANAGTDKVLVLPTKALTVVGSATDSDGTISLYEWTKISGPAASMNNTATSKLWAYNLVQGAYVFRLTVKDNSGNTAYDDVKVTVQSASSTPEPSISNIAPKANAGNDQTIFYPTKALTVVGTGTDTDGSIVSYQWTKISGPSASLLNTTTPKLWAYNLLLGTYTFRLTVKDNLGGIAYDDVKITVSDAATSIKSFSSDSTYLIREGYASLGEHEKTLGNLSTAQLENSTVVIYNDSGKRLFAGSWGNDSQRDVMTEKGLYIYNVIRDGQRAETGKIFIR